MNTLIAYFQTSPRVVRWVVLAGVAIAFYFGAVEPAVDQVAKLNTQGDVRAARLLGYAGDATEREEARRTITTGVRKFGQIQSPGDPRERSVALSRRISEILEKHSVRDHTSTVRETPLGPGPLATAVGNEFRIDRLVNDLQFDTTPERLSAILADLERAPEIAAVSKLQVRSATGRDAGPRSLRVSLAAEAWVLQRKARSR